MGPRPIRRRTRPRRFPEDERATIDAGRDWGGRILPGHVEVARRLLLDPLPEEDVRDHMCVPRPCSAARRKRRTRSET
ncbi:hypothetical protein [Spongiactinospora sp. 9N601]|uniref:hypothetical protein n=1 Tax=Spongiactinospora sp. 9N601 TaxID=3375149 RepID=UPI0037B6E5F2